MEYHNFRNHLSQILGVPITSLEFCSTFYEIKEVKKHEIILREGEISDSTFFVEKGLLRMYSIDKAGKEHVIQFAPENWIISDTTSQLLNEKSRFYIEAIEESTIIVTKEGFFENLSKIYPDVAEKNQRLMFNHIKSLQNRVNALISTTAEERYMDFLKKYPSLMLRAPQWMVASYLGITPESLSRVRKELAKKKFEI
ncbi:Crp/Fnr family transcriptional regulator [Epilithonimonas ginsengisoli]|uniref:Crp/Fnr family transcriptional regulator n=1 Tax=Epilithonimonas ginsengisoli TaxID=1245592 RepID=A0ABU4JJ62_9FLAO|nr:MULTISPECIES: Crp/Fnr family transcriptional regulator [Chryseobacterium group]MBO6200100.1 Crp/Fnr family transcriptional regulator [Chryseobacterium sp.]MBV6880827.1 Crp/Fnr family transcriptional regulator [Epilithonimonas sp. FP105]MDW8549603.1 Crp/Fnr family transcriptional regulator [Epilithonimonas ginsengisoli]OAH76732.1 Crp/Fnr family transcriptional regulator [Chryseobacterium sp. FP211-J200]